jgi:hypothetical protein
MQKASLGNFTTLNIRETPLFLTIGKTFFASMAGTITLLNDQNLVQIQINDIYITGVLSGKFLKTET